MRMPMKARSPAPGLALLVALASLLSACAGDRSTAPVAAERAKTPEAKSLFVPDQSNKALFGIVDGTYTFVIDPTRDQALNLGPNYLSLPANSVCNLGTSGYGSSYWNQSCTPQTLPLTITVIITNAATDHPQVDFFPAMRFNPAKTVQLFLYVPKANPSDAHKWDMVYCPTGSSVCIDESKSDPSLTSYVDRNANVVFRRIKHFSGYVVVGGRSDDPPVDEQ